MLSAVFENPSQINNETQNHVKVKICLSDDDKLEFWETVTENSLQKDDSNFNESPSRKRQQFPSHL